MEQPNSSLIQFDNIVLDVNENPSDADYPLTSDIAEQSKSASTNVAFPDDLNICDSSNYSEPFFYSPKMPESVAELKTEVDSQNIDNGKLGDITSGNLNLPHGCGSFMSDFNNQDKEVQANSEVFRDAVQYFNPSSLAFLENAGGISEPLNPRSSLYLNFDPLHAKCSPHVAKKFGELEEMSKDNSTVDEHLVNVNTSQQLLENTLISFDSLVVDKDENAEPTESKPHRLYNEEELQQALKIQELSMQEVLLKKQHKLELQKAEKVEEIEVKITRQHRLCLTLHEALKEVTEIACNFSEEVKNLQLNFENVEKENAKLKEDLKTSVEDLQSVENTFSDFHKRYEQCKIVLKVYTQNEGNFKQQIENLNIKLQEKEEMYNALQSRTEEMLDKANIEVANVKKSGDSQIAVLNAQLKTAELKISSLESDVRHVKIENVKMNSIWDELLTKVSEG